GVARQCPGGVARQHVDLARLQRGEAILGRQRHELDLGRIVEDGRRDRPADVDVEAGPVTLVVRGREARQALADAAGQHAAVLDRLEGLRRGGLGRETGGNGKGKNQGNAFHGQVPFGESCGNIYLATWQRLQLLGQPDDPSRKYVKPTGSLTCS